jgi:hypothetical protein
MVDAPASRRSPIWASAGALAVLVAFIPGPRDALAARDLTITQTPAISGTAQVGQMLTSTPGAWVGDPPPAATYLWLRCGKSPPGDEEGDQGDGGDKGDEGDKGDRRSQSPNKASDRCIPIAGTTGLSYAPVAEDVGYTLRIFLSVSNGSGDASGLSTPTSAVRAPVLPAVLPAVSTPPRLLYPFPVVRIRGRMTARGARITLLTVHAPLGARVRVSCSGTGCPVKRWAHTAALTRVRAFEHVLAAGVRLTVTVTGSGRIGKHTVILIRRSRAPLRRDRCLFPGSARPTRCPS